MLFLPVDKVSPVLASRRRPFIPYMLFLPVDKVSPVYLSWDTLIMLYLPVDKVSPVLASRGRPWRGGGDLLRWCWNKGDLLRRSQCFLFCDPDPGNHERCGKYEIKSSTYLSSSGAAVLESNVTSVVHSNVCFCRRGIEVRNRLALLALHLYSIMVGDHITNQICHWLKNMARSILL